MGLSSIMSLLQEQSPLLITLLITSVVTLSLLLLLSFKTSTQGKPHGVLPSPSKIPLIGNLHQLGLRLHRSFHDLAQKHGPLMLLHFGQAPILVVSSPDAAKEIFRTHDQVFGGRFVPKPVRILFDGGTDLAFSSCGEQWRQLRKICTVHLLSSTRVQSYWRMREEEVAFMIQRISSEAASPTTTAINMSEILYAFTNDITCRIVSGKFSRKEERNALFRKLTDEIIELLRKLYVGDLVPWLGWLDVFSGNLVRAKKNKMRWDDLLDQVIKEHEDKMMAGTDDDDEKDFVDVLLSLRRDDPGMDAVLIPSKIKSLLIDLFVGGTDTTYVPLEFALAELVRNPRVMKILQNEVRGKFTTKEMVREQDLKGMMYLKAVIKEVLRLHPSLPTLVPHQSMEDCQIQGYKIAKETRAFVNVWAIMRDPKYWERPEEFKPERFMDSAVDFKGNDMHFIPFGSGRRICPGMQFGTSILELALANLVYHFDWELPDGVSREELHVDEAPGIVSQREGRLHLVAKPWSV